MSPRSMGLDVPVIRQTIGSNDCGLCVTAMVLRYYGRHDTIEQLRERACMQRDGMYFSDIATLLERSGVRTTFVTLNAGLFTAAEKELPQSTIKARLERLIQKRRDGEAGYRGLRRYLNAGGTMRSALPTAEILYEAIGNKQPVIATLDARYISEKRFRIHKQEHHVQVIRDINERDITVNDSWWGWHGGIKTYPTPEYLYAVHATSANLPDDGGFIIARGLK